MGELDRAAISLRLASSREQAGLTQDEMGEILSLHWRSVQNYESPKVDRVPWDRLDEWAKATGVSRDWLLHGDQTPEPANVDEIRRLRGEVAELRVAVDRMLAFLLGQAEPPADSERP